VSPGALDRMKPYFKPRPRAGVVPQQAPTQAQPVTVPAPQAPAPTAAPAPGPASADAAGLAARREQLAKSYRELESDLGGLVYEMAIRDAFRIDVIVRRAAELQAVDAELTAVEQALGLAPRTPAAGACPHCGAPGPPGSAFCGRCGASLQAPAPAPVPAAQPAPPPSPAPPGTPG
jgi:hypothetical protein